MHSPSEERPRLLLVGLGGVGRSFLELLEEREVAVDVVGAVDSRGPLGGDGAAAADPRGDALSPRDLLALKADPARGELPHISLDPIALVARTAPDVVVDLTSCSFETGEPSLSLLRAGLAAGASVVTANKAPLARAWTELTRLAREHGGQIGYASAAGAALPAVAVAQALGRADRIDAFEGVLTGTSSYVLAQVATGTPVAEAIADAQAAGIAEPDPTMDLGGWDTAAKLVILANTIWPATLAIEELEVVGIDEQSVAGLEGAAIHLVGRAERAADGSVIASVRPRGIPAGDPLAALEPGEKAVVLRGGGIGEVVLSGGRSSPRGAASAVLGDVLRILEVTA
ncbi:hypothetical protein [Conexibacter sp. CPCC 206217]|uniref:hypothetical protein n=1 Tax=Conexibacter sp. CPCC 206217 TaxID=3064574 RepID=UPI00271B81FB|nr:hypothetical protein [Conexibacter sp. CPCC 206217]MDO8212523.1 hypothetical protein [Conexibacter sp. CPCC 206217]